MAGKKDTHLIELIIKAVNLSGGDLNKANEDVQALNKKVDELRKTSELNNKETKKSTEELEKLIKNVEKSTGAKAKELGLTKEQTKAVKDHDKSINKLMAAEEELSDKVDKRVAQLEKETIAEEKLLKAKEKRVTFGKKEKDMYRSTGDENIVIRDMGKEKGDRRYVAEHTTTGKRKQGKATLNQAKLAAQELHQAENIKSALDQQKKAVQKARAELAEIEESYNRVRAKRVSMEFDAANAADAHEAAIRREIDSELKLQKIIQDGQRRKESNEVLDYRKRKLRLDREQEDLNERLAYATRKQLELKRQGVVDPQLEDNIAEFRQRKRELSLSQERLRNDKAHVDYLIEERKINDEIGNQHARALGINAEKDRKAARERQKERDKEIADQTKLAKAIIDRRRQDYVYEKSIDLDRPRGPRTEEEYQKKLKAQKKKDIEEEVRDNEKAADRKLKLYDALVKRQKLSKRDDLSEREQLEFGKTEESIERLRVEIKHLGGDYDDVYEKAKRHHEEVKVSGTKAVDKERERLVQTSKLRKEESKLFDAYVKRIRMEGRGKTTGGDEFRYRSAVADVERLELSLKRLGGEHDNVLRKARAYYKTIDVGTRNQLKWEKDRSFLSNVGRNLIRVGSQLRDTESRLGRFRMEMKRVSAEGGKLSRWLARVGLAVRGLMVITVLSFSRALAASLSALAGQAAALAGSLVYAAGALGGVFVGALAQALPVVGLFIGALQRLKVIQDAVGQSDLLSKQTFGGGSDPTPDIKKQVDATDRATEAQRGLKDAQENLTKARKDAKKELQDLIMKEREAELAFRGAVLSQSEAQRALREAQKSGDVEGISRAQLDRDTSNFDKNKARRELQRARAEKRRGQKGGVENTDGVKNATKAVADAQRNLAQAHDAAADAAVKQIAAERNLNYFLSELTGTEKELYEQFMSFRERLDEVMKPITDIIFKSVIVAFERIQKFLFSPEIISGFTRLAEIIGSQIERVSKVLTSSGFTQFFSQTIKESGKNIPILVEGFIALANAFKNIATAVAPALTRFFEFIVDRLWAFNDIVSDTGRMDNFFQTGLDHFEAWFNLITSLLGLIGALMGVSGDSAIGTIQSLTDTINGASDALKNDDGSAADWFADSAKALSYIGGTIVELGKAFIELSDSNHVKALADIFTEVFIPGLVKGIEMAGIFAVIIDRLIKIPIVAEIGQWILAFGLFGLTLGSIAKLFKPFYILIKALLNVLGAEKVGQSFLNFFRWIPIYVGDFIRALSKSEAIIALFRRGLAGIPVIGWIIAAVLEVVIGAINALKDNFLGIGDYVSDALSDLGDAFGNLWAALSGGGEGAASFLDILKSIGNAFLDVIGFIMDIIGFIGKLAGAIAILAIFEIIIKPLTTAVNLIAKFVGLFTGFIRDIKSVGILQALKNLGSGILELMGSLIGSMINGFLRIPKLVLKGLEFLIKNIVPWMLDFGKAFLKGIGRVAKWVFNAAKDVGKEFINSLFHPSDADNKFNQLRTAIADFFINLPGTLWNILKAAGKALWKGLVSSLDDFSLGVANTIVGAIINVINFVLDKVDWLIDQINKVSPFKDIPKLGEIEKPDLKEQRRLKQQEEEERRNERRVKRERKLPLKKQEQLVLDRRAAGGEGSAKNDEKDAKAREKRNKSTKKATEFELNYFKTLGKSGGASRKQIKLNNQFSKALDSSSRAHKRATNLQKSLNSIVSKGVSRQRNYAESIRKTTRAERNLNEVIRKSRKFRDNYNGSERKSIRIKDNLSNASRKIIRVQQRLADSTRTGSKAQETYSDKLSTTAKNQGHLTDAVSSGSKTQSTYNDKVRSGTKLSDKYENQNKKTTKSIRSQSAATRALSRKFKTLSGVLRVTGENSRALGVVFKSVTNKILKEFNVDPIKVDLPEVSGMFKVAMSDIDGFDQGGYFGSKRERGQDDRYVKVAGGEAFLTGFHQREANRAFAVANAVGATPYGSLDSMFNKDKRKHAGSPQTFDTPGFNRGGRNNNRRNTSAGGRSIVIPRSVPDADGALPGLDLMGWLANKYFGLSVTSGKDSHSLMTSSGNVSDHSWGGAIDISNGSSPTPQMDAAWQWFANVLGTGGSWRENYMGGAIKQMLYRTNIGGNHFNHIHLALTEQYARNVEALTKILTGQAIPVATGDGTMFVQAPQLKKPKIKGDKGIPRKMLQGQSDKFTGAANKYLKANIQTSAGGNITALVGPPGEGQPVGASMYGGPTDSVSGTTGYRGDNLVGKMAYAELGYSGGDASSANLLGGLPYKQKLKITYGNKSVIGEKLDIGAGGGDVGGYPRAIDLWHETANALGFGTGVGVVKVELPGPKGNFKSDGRSHDVVASRNRGGTLPEFHDGGVVGGQKGLDVVTKLRAGETVLPTHKIDGFNRGGANGPLVAEYDPIGGSISVKSAKSKKKATSRTNKTISKFRARIEKLRAKLEDEENLFIIDNLKDRIQQYKDSIDAAKIRQGYDKDIRDARKKIREKQKELEETEGKNKKKNISKEINKLTKDLRELQKERRSVRVFEGVEYNIDNVRDMILLISDRIESFIQDIDDIVTKASLATAKWTYKIKKVGGKKIVSNVRTAMQEAQRALSDLNLEYKEIAQALRETRRASIKTKNRINKERKSYDKQIRKLQQKRNKEDDKKEREAITNEIEKLRKNKKDDLQKLRTSLNNINNKRQELLQRSAENLANRYEAQNRIFEESMQKFEDRTSRIEQNQTINDKQIEMGNAPLSSSVKFILNKRSVLEDKDKTLNKKLKKAKKANNKQGIKMIKELIRQNQIDILQTFIDVEEINREMFEEVIESFGLDIIETSAGINDLMIQLGRAPKESAIALKLEARNAIILTIAELEKEIKRAQDSGDKNRVKELTARIREAESSYLGIVIDIRELNKAIFEDLIESFGQSIVEADSNINDLLIQLGVSPRESAINFKVEMRTVLEKTKAALEKELERVTREGDTQRAKEISENIKSVEADIISIALDIREINKTIFEELIDSFGQSVIESNSNINDLLITLGKAPKESAIDFKVEMRKVLVETKAALEKELEKAIKEGNTEWAKEISERIRSVEADILSIAIDIREINKDILETAIDAIGINLLDADQNINDLLIELGKMPRESAMEFVTKRESMLLKARKLLTDAYNKAIEEDDQQRAREIEELIKANEADIIQLSLTMRDIRKNVFEGAMSDIESRSFDGLTALDSLIRINELKYKDDDGDLTEEGRANAIELHRQREAALLEQKKVIEDTLRESLEVGDKEIEKEMRQALLDNEIALLENTDTIKELSDAVGKIFDFRSTSWDMFRRAVLNGQGEIIPELASTVPQLASGGYIKKDGLAYLHAGEVVLNKEQQARNNGPLVDTINFTQPMEVADPVAISNKIGFKLSTLKSI